MKAGVVVVVVEVERPRHKLSDRHALCFGSSTKHGRLLVAEFQGQAHHGLIMVSGLLFVDR
jgi:hypothetical protein